MSKNSFSNPKSLVAITPSDTTDLANPSRIYCGGAGNVKVTSALNSGTVTFINVPAGTMLDAVVIRVWSGSTTCSGIIAGY